MPEDELPGLDLSRLRDFLEREDLVDGSEELDAQLLTGGYSNLTYLLHVGSRTMVLRRPPHGDVAVGAHDVGRELRVLTALAPPDVRVPVPVPIVGCDDASFIGAPFYLMEHLNGRVMRDREATSGLTEQDARRCSITLVQTLADIHLLDPLAVGLADLGRPVGYMARQVERWTKQLEGIPVRDRASFETLGFRLRRSLPDDSPGALLHGDYRIDNVVLDLADAGTIQGVLDWEMATLGDPLADLGMFLLNWGEEGEELFAQTQGATSSRGFLRRDEVCELYSRRTGASLDDLDFYLVFAHFKLAAITEGLYQRRVRGEVAGSDLDQVTNVAPILLGRALELAASSSLRSLRP